MIIANIRSKRLKIDNCSKGMQFAVFVRYKTICYLVYEKGPYVSSYSQWQTYHILLHVLGHIDCKRHRISVLYRINRNLHQCSIQYKQPV